MLPRDRVSEALKRKEGTAIVAFITAGYPDAGKFLDVLDRVASAADAVEIGVPFSDPMADGVTIQRSSEQAIARAGKGPTNKGWEAAITAVQMAHFVKSVPQRVAPESHR